MTQIRPEHLQRELEKGLAPAYVIHGDEPLLALEAADAVRAAARRHGYAEREVLEAGRGFDWSAFRHAGASLALFGGRKLLELRLTGARPGTQGGEAIAAYCERPNPEVLLLVTLPRLDRATQGAAWFAALSRSGVLVDVWPVERSRLPAWISERLARQGQRASRAALELLADRVEGNLLAAHQEVQKLALLLPPGQIEVEALREAVASVARFDVYGACEALLAGEGPRYVRVIDALRSEGESPSLVLWALAEELQALARIQAGLAAGGALEDLLRENRVWGPRQRAMRAAAGRIAPRSVRRALGRAAGADRVIKGVAVGEPWDDLLKLGEALLR